jgi:hypothetical protein
MMKYFKVLGAIVVLAVGSISVSQEQPSEAPKPMVPKNMFISSDTDDFDAGLPVGAQFPAIRALYQGSEIADIDQFIRDKGAVFLAMRSVDW